MHNVKALKLGTYEGIGRGEISYVSELQMSEIVGEEVVRTTQAMSVSYHSISVYIL